MKTFVTNSHSRKDILVANSICNELNYSIEIFDPINIYDIYLANNDHVFVISENDSNNIFISKFINDLTTGSIQEKNNKIVFLYKDNDLNKTRHCSNIISIPYNIFCHYNEYTKLKMEDNGYILCELNCISQKKNSVLDNIIYPQNNSIPVRLVNCPRYDHPQNLGVVNDYDMLKLIAGCKVYIGLTDNYIYDSINMQKPTITVCDNKIVPVTQSISMKDILDCVFNESYLSELHKNKISNIIKYKLK